MLWAGQGKGILGGWRTICLVVSLLLQHPGVNSKCYFQAQGKGDWCLREMRGDDSSEVTLLEYICIFSPSPVTQEG